VWSPARSACDGDAGAVGVTVFSGRDVSGCSTLVDGQELVRQLQDDHGDGGAIDRSDAIAVPRPVGLLLLDELVAGRGEVIVPLLVAGLVDGLAGVEVRVEIVPASLAEALVQL